MKVEELINELNKMKIPKDIYSILGEGLPNEMMCMQYVNKKWEVFYSERGHKSGLIIFEDEDSACDYFFQVMKRTYNNLIKSGWIKK